MTISYVCLVRSCQLINAHVGPTHTFGLLRATARSALLSYSRDVHPSVCPSVTLCDCAKTVQARTTKSLLCAVVKTPAFCDKIFCQWVKGFSLNEGIKRDTP